MAGSDIIALEVAGEETADPIPPLVVSTTLPFGAGDFLSFLASSDAEQIRPVLTATLEWMQFMGGTQL